MNHTIDLVIAVSGMMLSLLSLIRLLHLSYLEKNVRRFFFLIFGVLGLYSMCILTRELIRDQSGYAWAVLSRVVLFSQAFLSSLLAVIIIVFLLYQTGESDCLRQPVFRAAVLLRLVYVGMLVWTQFSGKIYAVDDQNRYGRGPLFWVQMIAPALIMALHLQVLWRKREMLSRKQRLAFACYVLIPLLGMLIQTALFGVHMIALGTVIAALVLYNQIVSDQMERFIRNKEENTRIKIDLLMAQIQPHFLFNSLTTIRHLCRKNPDLAEEAVTKFTEYLRYNMDSLETSMAIPFEEELKHVQSYLALQQIRFGDDLSIQYDLQCTDFRLPTLSIQPLMENAVSYGVRKNESGAGRVTIRTREYPDRIEVTVEDDGPGFDPEALPHDPERSHTGIRNVRERLRRIGGGDLRIDSAPGRGTRATIILDRNSSGTEPLSDKKPINGTP